MPPSFTVTFRPRVPFRQPYTLVWKRSRHSGPVINCHQRNLKAWVLARTFLFSTSRGQGSSPGLSSMDREVLSFKTVGKLECNPSTWGRGGIENQPPRNKLEIHVIPKSTKQKLWLSLMIQKAFEQMLRAHHDKHHLPLHRKLVHTRVN